MHGGAYVCLTAARCFNSSGTKIRRRDSTRKKKCFDHFPTFSRFASSARADFVRCMHLRVSHICHMSAACAFVEREKVQRICAINFTRICTKNCAWICIYECTRICSLRAARECATRAARPRRAPHL